MKTIILALLFLLGNFGSTFAQTGTVSDRYIVILKEGKDLKKNFDKAKGKKKKAFEIINGYVVTLSKSELEDTKNNPDVEAVEQDKKIFPSEDTSAWHLDRIDQTTQPLNGQYNYSYTGQGVTAYIIDTGINYNHVDFQGRASLAVDFFGEDGRDCNGHGTHVAGLVGSRTYGVAKEAQLKSVRIGYCDGSAYVSTLIDGVNWVARNGSKPSVVNLSYNVVGSSATSRALKGLVAKGYPTVVSAGNNGADACNDSVAGAQGVYAVSATGDTDIRWGGSNYGACVDIHAPGIVITSLAHYDTTSTRIMGGTSMASPIVAGAFATYLQVVPTATPLQVGNFISSVATQNVVVGTPSGEVNNLLFTNFTVSSVNEKNTIKKNSV